MRQLTLDKDCNNDFFYSSKNSDNNKKIIKSFDPNTQNLISITTLVVFLYVNSKYIY